MKKTLFESRLDNTIDAGSIGIGETVEVRNKMGIRVSSGDVVASTPFGLSLNDGSFYHRDLYLFAVEEVEQPVVVGYQLLSSPDERVKEKLSKFGESTIIFEVDKMNNNDSIDKSDEDDDIEDKKTKDKTEPDNSDKKDKKNNGDSEPLANPNSSVDINSLPEDIKKAVISTVQMNEDQLNSVLSEIGDAIVKALKRINIKDPEIYNVVGNIQDAAEKILTTPISRNSMKK